jgi:hypothetical protein
MIKRGRRPSTSVIPIQGDLVVQEYVSLRNESLAAKQNQQTILQWTLATVGVVIAASVAASIATGDLSATERPGVLFVGAALTGFVLPTVIACALGIWLGEVGRMERAGHFLRSREAAWSQGLAINSLPDDPTHGLTPLWETMLKDAVHPMYRKNWLGTFASVALFGTLMFSSLAAGLLVAVGPGGLVDNCPAIATCGEFSWAPWVWSGIMLTAVPVLCFASLGPSWRRTMKAAKGSR